MKVVQSQIKLMMINFKFEASVLQVKIGWPNSAQNLVTSRFVTPCSTRRHSTTCEPILKWKTPSKSSPNGLSNDMHNMAQMFLLAHTALYNRCPFFVIDLHLSVAFCLFGAEQLPNLFFSHAYITKYLHDLLPIRCLNYETFIFY